MRRLVAAFAWAGPALVRSGQATSVNVEIVRIRAISRGWPIGLAKTS